jgi:hypothetical protein
MPASRRTRLLILVSLLYFVFSVAAGIFLADGALHPSRRPLTKDEKISAHETFSALNAELKDASITAQDGAVLRAWLITPEHANGSTVILLHGLGDNRMGMIGYARLFLAHGFTTLLPDARAHGESGGQLATYGLLERDDVRRWFDFLAASDRPQCIFGFGESMGAAQLLQSLDAVTRFCAVAAESSFSNFREIAYDRIGQPFHLGPWFGKTFMRPTVEAAFLRAWWKYKLDMSQISPEDSVKASRTPVLLIHGQIDSNIPVHHSRRIHQRNPNTVLWEVPDADHCGAVNATPQEFNRRLIAWFAIPAVSSQKLRTGN